MSLKAIVAGGRLVQIPRYVCGDNRDAEIAHQFQSSPPSAAERTEIMKIAADEEEFFTVQIDSVLFDFNCFHRLVPCVYFDATCRRALIDFII